MNHNRFLVFAWNIGKVDGTFSDANPLTKIKVSCKTINEAEAKAKEFSDINYLPRFYDFVTIFDCSKRMAIKEYDNIPF